MDDFGDLSFASDDEDDSKDTTQTSRKHEASGRDTFAELPLRNAHKEGTCIARDLRRQTQLRYTTTETMRNLRCGRRNFCITLDLSRLLELPRELIIEILGHLHPLDLIHLSQSSKALRALLLTLDVVWKDSFSNTDIPPIPQGITGRYYALLLFGPPICYECRSRPALPDFVILRHLCTSCIQRTLPTITITDIHLKWEWFPCSTRRSNGTDDRVGGVPRFLPPLIPAIHCEVKKLEQATARGDLEAQERFDQFVSAQAAQREAADQRLQRLDYWARKLKYEAVSFQDRQARILKGRYCKRLRKQGHEEADIQCATIERIIERPYNMRFKNTAFQRALPALEQAVVDGNQRRKRWMENGKEQQLEPE